MLPHRKHDLEEPLTRSNHSKNSRSLSELAARYRTTGRQVILYAGTFEPYQGLELLVDAAPIVTKTKPATRFLCLGGNEAQIAALRRRTCNVGVEDLFIFPGVLPPEDIETHFALADVLVSPRVSGTNTPLKIYSYLRSGIPILATNIRSHTQVLTSEVALLVEPSVDAIAAGILTLLEDDDLCSRLSHNARELAQDKFSAEAYHEKVAQVYAFLEARKMSQAV